MPKMRCVDGQGTSGRMKNTYLSATINTRPPTPARSAPGIDVTRRVMHFSLLVAEQESRLY